MLIIPKQFSIKEEAFPAVWSLIKGYMVSYISVSGGHILLKDITHLYTLYVEISVLET
jgi:hypothetical protein